MSDRYADLRRGLPGRLPPGETLLWQGAPDWRSLARSFHVRGLTLYFAALVAWFAVSTVSAGGPVGAMAFSVGKVALCALVAVGIVVLFAFLSARTTVYSITSRRLVMHCGVALPKSVNLPLRAIDGALLRERGNGTGDIVVTLGLQHRVAHLLLWPHIRPWRLSRAQPMLRAVPNAQKVAATLTRALEATLADRVHIPADSKIAVLSDTKAAASAKPPTGQRATAQTAAAA